MRALLIWSITLVGLLMVCPATMCAQDHADAMVTRIGAETDDSIAFEISVVKKTYAEQEDIAVNYFVRNKSRRTMYLVTGPAPRVRIKETFVVELIEPVKGPDDHEQYDYELIKILPGKSYAGKSVIKATELRANAKYSFETVTIQTGFSYLFDVSNLGGCKEASYVLPCLREIYDKSKTLTVGNLVVKRNVK